MHALAIEFHGMRERNLVPREKLLVAVTGSASVRQILLGYRRGRIARGMDLMDGPMAGHAVGCVRVACRGSLPVYALPEFFHFVGMALRAFCRRYLDRDSNLVWIAMAGLAGSVAEGAMNALRRMSSFVGVASRAPNLRDFVGVRDTP